MAILGRSSRTGARPLQSRAEECISRGAVSPSWQFAGIGDRTRSRRPDMETYREYVSSSKSLLKQESPHSKF